ncbi:putative uncharacterized protein DDB_G0277255 isoform X2 [Tetranychus urticae]|uniref:putative uncharacterized protein DDB_G0277255 isoform X2 n=1 Tax=Tetranychus urticae TaxID=32264 RepID=UPI00077BC281|nr:putative uncharacterized protein DDB_G0277255 isoform X2 [Tetranychus urticae]
MPTMTNKGPEMVMKNFKTEEDDRCRSLVCDPSGIIVAEMVYRCMICFYITDTMVEAKQHYTSKHMDDDDDKDIDRNRESFLESTDNNNNNNVTSGLNYINHNHILNNNHSNGNSSNNINRHNHLNSLMPQLNGPYYKNYSGDEGLSPDDGDNYDPYSPLVTMTEDLRRQHLIEEFRPIRAKPGTKGSGAINGAQALTAEALADLNLGSASTGPSPEGSAGSSSGEIPTLSIAYNTNGDGSLDLSTSLLNKNGTGRAKNEKPAAKVKITPGKKVWSCGKCATCMAEDCGKCIYCLDRPKFGGPFIKKQRCIKRRCLNKVKNKAANGNAA